MVGDLLGLLEAATVVPEGGDSADPAGVVAGSFLLSRRSMPKMLGQWLITMMDYLACFRVGNLLKISVILAVDYSFPFEPFPSLSMEVVADQLLDTNWPLPVNEGFLIFIPNICLTLNCLGHAWLKSALSNRISDRVGDAARCGPHQERFTIAALDVRR